MMKFVDHFGIFSWSYMLIWTFHPPPNISWSWMFSTQGCFMLWCDQMIVWPPTLVVIMIVWHLNCAEITNCSSTQICAKINNLFGNQVWMNLCFSWNLSWSWGIIISTCYYFLAASFWGVQSWNFYTPLFKRDHLWKPSKFQIQREKDSYDK